MAAVAAWVMAQAATSGTQEVSNMDKNAEKITITYDDGSTKELKRGLVFHIEGNPFAQ